MKNTVVNIIITTSICCSVILASTGCKKSFLDAKPSTSILQPNTLNDFEGLLYSVLPYTSPALPTLAADEYQFISYPIWQSTRTSTERNSYLWAGDLYAGETNVRDWNAPFEAIFYTNNVLAGLERIEDSEKDIARLKVLRGTALFKRAFAYYELVSCFSPAYDESTADKDLGIPIRITPSIDELQPRASVQKTYDLILEDLNLALPLLSNSLTIASRDRPSKIAVHALLSRVYLSMGQYDLAELHSDATLQLYDKLIDYNSVSTTSTEPFNRTNDELLYFKIAAPVYASVTIANNSYTRINPQLIAMYEPNDLRALVYFAKQTDGNYVMKYQYNGATGLYPFTGLASDEIYLIKAECAARRSDISTALRYVNDLLIKRFKTNTYIPFSATTADGALSKILLERRKELVWRNLRFSDLKRLNKDGANITLTRILNGQTYTLPPNDVRYVFPIPDDEIALSGIQQNIR